MKSAPTVSPSLIIEAESQQQEKVCKVFKKWLISHWTTTRAGLCSHIHYKNNRAKGLNEAILAWSCNPAFHRWKLPHLGHKQTNRARLLIGSVEIWPRPLQRSHVTIHGANVARALAWLGQGRHWGLSVIVKFRLFHHLRQTHLATSRLRASNLAYMCVEPCSWRSRFRLKGAWL